MNDPAARISTLTAIEADSNNNLPDRIHLLRVGKFSTEKYGNLDIMPQDAGEMVDNFHKGYGRPGATGAKIGIPVNYKHDKGANAAAWINDLEFDGKDLWGTKLDWTGTGKKAVTDKEYRCISSEFTPRCMGGLWTNPENTAEKIRNVLTGAALTNIPMFSGNHAITASTESNDSDIEQTIYISASKEDEKREIQMPTLDEVRIKDASNLTKEDKQVIASALVDGTLDKAEITKFAPVFGIEASTDTPQTIEASAVVGTEGKVTVEASAIKSIVDENKELKSKVEASEGEKSDLQKKVEAHETQLKESKQKEVKASVEEHAKRGAIVASQVDSWANMIIDNPAMEDTLKALPGNPTVAADNLGQDEAGAGGTDAATVLDAKAKEIMASDSDVTYANALVKARRDNPELVKQDNAAVSGE